MYAFFSVLVIPDRFHSSVLGSFNYWESVSADICGVIWGSVGSCIFMVRAQLECLKNENIKETHWQVREQESSSSL